MLIIDDDEGTVNAFSRILHLRGYETATAMAADAGWQQLERSRPDAILLDLRMPGMDGITFLRRLRLQQAYRRIPVAVITGDPSALDTAASELRDLDAKLYLKPLRFEDVLGIVAALLMRPMSGDR